MTATFHLLLCLTVLIIFIEFQCWNWTDLKKNSQTRSLQEP